jgi:hemerythrin superfamily protein
MNHQNGQEFEKNFQTLRAEVQLHITSEEGEIFPQVQSLTNEVTMARLGDELETAKGRLRERVRKQRFQFRRADTGKIIVSA